MAHIKNRKPEFFFTEDASRASSQFDKLSKADWADLYYDLYRQVFGETTEGSEIVADIAERIEILKRNRSK